MTFEDIAEKAGGNILTYLFVSALGFGGFLIRRVFTNQETIKDNQAANDKRLDELQTEIRTREEFRVIDRNHFLEKIDDLKLTIHETRDDVKKLRQG